MDKTPGPADPNLHVFTRRRDGPDERSPFNRSSTKESNQVSDTRPSLLFLCQTLPYPADGGVNIRTYNIMRLLSQAFRVTALCFYRKASRPTPEHVEASLSGLRSLADVKAFSIPADGSRLRTVWDHVRSAATRRVYTRYVYDSNAFVQALESVLQTQRFDLVHLDSLDLARYLEPLGELPVVCTHHNVESDLLRRRANNEAFPLSRYLHFQARLMEEEERSGCSRVSMNVAVSRLDAERLAQISPDGSFTVVPNGVDTDYFRSSPANAHRENGLVFVGGYTWYPNRDALGYFADAILPLIRRQIPDIPVTWVGAASDATKQHFAAQHNIHLTGYVDDVRPYIDSASCYIVPLRVGGGTRLKILDAWAMGRAIVSTSAGAEGLEAVDGTNILIRDTPAEFAQAVTSVVKEPALRRRLAESGRTTAVSTYDWNVLGRHLIEQYNEVLRNRTHAYASSMSPE